MRDSRAAVIIFPSDPQHAEPASPPGRYVIRCCRAVALVALGATMHVVLPDQAVPVVPVITPLRFVAPTPGPGTRRVVVERSTVLARPLELDDMRHRRENSRPFPAIGDVPITRSVSLTGGATPAAPVATSGESETAEVSAADERAATVAATEVLSVETANTVDPGNARPDPLPRGGDAVKAVNETPAAANPIVAPIAAPAVREAAHVISEEELVRRLLAEYAGAYERLDVGAAKAVWPTVDGKALKRAFAQLSAQRVTLQSCGITISGRTANARCQGSATYQPRIGSRPVQIASREWTFDLSKQDTNWRIVNTLVR
jgi:hypothetical protein